MLHVLWTWCHPRIHTEDLGGFHDIHLAMIMLQISLLYMDLSLIQPASLSNLLFIILK